MQTRNRSERRLWKANFFTEVGVPLVGMFLPYAFLEFLTRDLLRFDIAFYEEPSFTLAYVSAKLPLLVPIALAQGVARYLLHRSNRDVPASEAREIRILVVLLCASLTWIFAGQGPNPLFEAGHQIDRWLLFGALLATAIRPSFTLIFWTFFLAHYGQLVVGPGNHAWSSLSLPRQVLEFIGGALWLRPLYRDRFPQFLRAGLLVLVAMRYWPSGIEKVALDWYLVQDFGNIVMASHVVGWLSFLSLPTFHALESGISTISPLLIAVVLFLEVGVLAILLSRRFAALLFGGLALFHVGVVTTMGTFFFHWILIDAFLVYSLLFRPDRWPKVFGAKPAAFCALLIVSAWQVGGLPGYAWIDLPVVEQFRFDLIDENGERWPVSPHWFAPYFGTAAAMNLTYLSPRPQFDLYRSTTTDLRTARNILSMRSLKEFEASEASDGSLSLFSEPRRDDLVHFMERFVPRRALLGERKPLFLLPPPRVRYMRRDGIGTVPSTGIRFVEIRRSVTFRSAGGLERGPEETVLKVDLRDTPSDR